MNRPDSTTVSAGPAPWSSTDRRVLAAILLGAAAAYLGTLTVNGMWADELTTAMLADSSYVEMLQERARAGHLPVYFSVIWCWEQLLGNGEFTVRIPSVLFGLGAVAMVYALVRADTGTGPAAASALLVAANPVHLYGSQMARMYSLVPFLLLVLLWLVRRAERRDGWRATLLPAPAAALLLLTSYSASFVVLPLALHLLLRRRPAWRPLAGLAAGLLLALPGFAFQWSFSRRGIDTGPISESLQHLGPFDVWGWLALPLDLFLGAKLGDTYLGLWASAAVVVLVVLGAVRMGERARLWLFLWAGMLACPAVLGLLDAPNITNQRYFTSGAVTQTVLIAGLLAPGLPWLWAQRTAVAALAVAFMGASVFSIYRPVHWSLRDPVEQTCRQLGEKDVLAVVGNRGVARAVRYYGNGRIEYFELFGLVPDDLDAFQNKANRMSLAKMRSYRAPEDATSLFVLIDLRTARQLEQQTLGLRDFPDTLGRGARFPKRNEVGKVNWLKLWRFTPN